MRTSLIGITISFSLLALAAQAQTPSFTSTSVLNAASQAAGPIAPGMVANITGTNLGVASFPQSCANISPVPTVCDGVSVLVNGTAAPVLFDSATEISFQVPFNIGGTTATIQVNSSQNGSTLSSSVVTVPVATTAPGLFTINGTGSGTAYYSDSGTLLAEVSTPVQVGDTVVLYATGFGATNPIVATGALGPNTPAAAAANVSMTINNQSVPVTFAGLQPGNLTGATVGYDEVVFTVPSGLTVPAGQSTATFPIVVTVGGIASQSANLIVATPLPAITSISPNPVPLSTSAQTITINGSGFQNGATVRVASPSGTITIPASSVTFVSSTQLTIQITSGTTAGSWALLVTNPDGGNSSSFQFTTSGTGPTATITSIVTTSSNLPQIAQNTWIEVHGTNLAQTTTTWSTLPASAFTPNLPTTLGNVSATVDGKAAAVYYVSPTQINILAPLDSATGTVPVQVTTPYGQTSIVTTTELTTSPAFLIIDPPAGHVAAEHLNYSLLGPASLSANGYVFTPAKAGETVVLYATGFGQTNPALTNEASGSGNALPTLPTVTIGNVPATVSFAGISAPGLYQLNVIVPTGLPSGDAALVASYNGSSTQKSVFLTLQ